MEQKKGEGVSSELTIVRKEIALQQQVNETEIDLLELAAVLLDKLHYIVLFFLLGAVLFNAYSFFFIHPTYEATASIYIVSASGGTVVDLTDLNIGSSLKSDYKELIMSYPVLDRVSSRLNLDWDTEKMSKAVSISNPTDTRILKLTATAESPELAMNIANTLATVAVQYLPETMSTESPNIAQKARLPEHKANPSYAKYTAIGGLLGAMLCCAWFIAKHLMDDTIRSVEDMEKYFGAAPLTAIPYVDLLANEKKRSAVPKKRRTTRRSALQRKKQQRIKRLLKKKKLKKQQLRKKKKVA